jgi:menaquinone-dependent protoporphyrinogen oxidase
MSSAFTSIRRSGDETAPFPPVLAQRRLKPKEAKTMQPILVAYATTEGQTRKIAEFIAERLRIRGHRVDLIDTATPLAQAVNVGYQAAFIGGSVHYDQHQGSLVHFVKSNLEWLNAMPTAFFSVSLAPVHADAGGVAHAQQAADRFVQQTGLKPLRVHLVGGALKYTQYDFFKRMMMKMISRQQGRTTDTAADHEYTDWADVEAFVDDFLRAVGGTAVAGVARAK